MAAPARQPRGATGQHSRTVGIAAAGRPHASFRRSDGRTSIAMGGDTLDEVGEIGLCGLGMAEEIVGEHGIRQVENLLESTLFAGRGFRIGAGDIALEEDVELLGAATALPEQMPGHGFAHRGAHARPSQASRLNAAARPSSS